MPACPTTTQFGHGFMNTSPECAACISLSQEGCKFHGRSLSPVTSSADVSYAGIRPQERARVSSSAAATAVHAMTTDAAVLSQSFAPAAASRWYSTSDTGLPGSQPIPIYLTENFQKSEREANALSMEYQQRAMDMFLRVKCNGDASQLTRYSDEDREDAVDGATQRTADEHEDLQFNLDLEL